MTWTVLQIALNLFFLAGGLVIWARLSRPAKDDPRLSKGLQLLQSKIAVLEDLSDRTDLQFKQLAALLEQKGREVQDSIDGAQAQIHRVEMSIQKSLEVSKIFQDKIPHKEIIERQNTIKYIQAARLAHQGQTVQEIAAVVDIPSSELEFIVKVNRNKLMFSEEHLPQWAQEPAEAPKKPLPSSGNSFRDMSQVFESFNMSETNQDNLKKLEQELKTAIEDSKPTPPEVARPSILDHFKNTLENHTITPSETPVETTPAASNSLFTQLKNSVKDKIQTYGEEIFSTQLDMDVPKNTSPKDAVRPDPIAIIKSGTKDASVKPFVFKRFDDTDPEEFMKI